MADTARRLTKTVVDRLRYEGRTWEGGGGKQQHERVIFWDTSTRGLGVRLLPSGRKVYVLRYKNPSTRKWRMVSIGEHGDVTLEQARIAADEKRSAVTLREADPIEEKQRRREEALRPPVDTLGALWESYVEVELPELRKSTRKAVKGVWRRYIEDSSLPGQRLDNIRSVDVKRLLQVVKAKSGKYARNDTLKLLRRLYSVAMQHEPPLVERDPTRAGGIKFENEKGRERYLDKAELAALSDSLAAEGDRRAECRNAADGIRLILLTGCRVGEIRKLRWEQIDFKRGLLSIPEDASKIGEDQTRELQAGALQVLQGLRERQQPPSEWVFPNRDDNGPRADNFQRSWERVRDGAGLEGVHLYDLRHTFGTWAIAGGLSLKMVADLMGHKQIQTTTRYAHVVRDARREAAERVAGSLEAMLEGDEGAEVVEFGRGG